MVKGDEWFMIRQMCREGLSISEIARRTGRDRKTVRKIIRAESQPVYKKRPQRPSQLDPHKAYVKERMEAGVTNSVKLLREIKVRGYTGSITILKDFMRPFRQRQKAVMRYETPPGYQAQVDWGTCGKIFHRGVLKTVYCFVMTLGYSRMAYVEFTVRCDTRAFIRCHINAFNFFSGVPKTCLYDNLKSVRLITSDDAARLNPTFLDFADQFGFEVKTCKPYRPETKGKVESGIGYVKGNFLLGETFSSLSELNASVLGWLNAVANVRLHGTTGEIPLERFAKENLNSLRPDMVFDTALYEQRKITVDCLVSYQGCRYSVPHKFAGSVATIRDHENGFFDVLVKEEVVATHTLSPVKGRTIFVSRHYEGIPQNESSLPQRLPILSPSYLPEVEERPLSVYESLVGGRA